MRKKILIPINNFTKKGGVERYTVELAQYLSDFYDVDILCGDYDKRYLNEHIHPIRIGISKNRYLALLFPFRTTKYIKKHRSEYFCIINNGIGFAHIQDVLIAQSNHRAWLKSLWSEGGIPKTVFDPANILITYTEARNYRKGHYKKIVAISNLVADQIVHEHKVPAKDIAVIHSGVNMHDFSASHSEKRKSRSEIRKKYGIPDDEVVLLFVANEFKRKGLDFIIDAISILKKKGIKFKLLVIGRDNPDKFSRQIRCLGLQGSIIFTGLVGDELRKYYFASDIFVFPTRQDAFALVITEAMAAGLPVITSRFAGAAELIDNNKDGIVLEKLSSSLLEEKLLSLIKNGEERKEIGINAVEKAKQYSWDKVFKKVKQVIDEAGLRQ